MATILQLRRGTTVQHSSFTGAVGEVTVDTTKNAIVVHDGVTAGGYTMALASDVEGTITLSDLSGGTGINYNSSTGEIAVDTTTIATQSWVTTQIQTKDNTDEITEGSTNLYFTTGRVDSHLSGGTGVTYSSGTISIGQDVSTSATPTFAGSNMSGDIIPTVDNTYSLGSPTNMWRDVYVGPGSLYVNGQKVLEENSGNIIVSADLNQNLVLQTSGSGDVELDPTGTGVIALKGPVQIQAGSNVASSDGNPINFSDDIAVDSVTSKTTNANLTLSGNGTGYVNVDDNLVIAGNLTVSGTTTTVNSETISLADNIVDLNSNFTTGAPTENAGIRIVRGDEANVQLRWNENTDKWQYTNDGSTYSDIGNVSTLADLSLTATATELNYVDGVTSAIQTQLDSKFETADFATTANTWLTAKNTDNLSEGSTNLYFTNTRARSAVSASGDLSYNSTTGTFSFSQDFAFSSLTGTPTDISGYGITDAYTKAEVDSAISTAVAGKDNTDEITEGSSNLYFTNARARGAVSVTDSGGDGSLTYNSSTGVITYTGPSASDVRAHFSAGTGITLTSGAIAVDSTIATKTYADDAATAAVAAVIDAAPATLDTLNELAAALGDDANFSTTITNSIATKLASADFDSTADTWLATKDTDDVAEGTTNQYFTTARARSSFSAGTGVTITSGAIAIGQAVGTTADVTFNSVTASLTGNASTATKLATARTIGGVSFDGSANINLPGVNTTGNQNTTGNAASLTGLTATVAELNYVDGVTSAIQTQLDAKLAASSYTAADVLTKLKTVDGAGSGLDADLLDGQSSAYFRINIYDASGTLLN